MEWIEKKSELQERGYSLPSFNNLVTLYGCPKIAFPRIEAQVQQMLNDGLNVNAVISSYFAIQWRILLGKSPLRYLLEADCDYALFILAGEGTTWDVDVPLLLSKGDYLFLPANRCTVLELESNSSLLLNRKPKAEGEDVKLQLSMGLPRDSVTLIPQHLYT